MYEDMQTRNCKWGHIYLDLKK